MFRKKIWWCMHNAIVLANHVMLLLLVVWGEFLRFRFIDMIWIIVLDLPEWWYLMSWISLMFVCPLGVVVALFCFFFSICSSCWILYLWNLITGRYMWNILTRRLVSVVPLSCTYFTVWTKWYLVIEFLLWRCLQRGIHSSQC